MSRVEGSGDQPRAMIHKQILQSAERNPDAPMSDIADGISGATTDLVEKVLEEYGDPGEPATDHATEPEDEEMSTNGTDETVEAVGETDGTSEDPADRSTPDDEASAAGQRSADAETGSPADSGRPSADELSAKQVETLVAVDAMPEGTQGDVAAALDVTRATVSRRLNDIPGFDWSDRAAFASSVLTEADREQYEIEVPGPDDEHDGSPAAELTGSEGTGESDERAETGAAGTDTTVSESEFEAALARIDDLESARERAGGSAATDREVDWSDLDPELAHKILAACMESEKLDEADEQRVVELLMGGSADD